MYVVLKGEEEVLSDERVVGSIHEDRRWAPCRC